MQKSTQKIICTDFANGKKHDFRLFKESKIGFLDSQKLLVDSGYSGILKIHALSKIPKKSTKKNPLTTEDKKQNHEISKERIVVENVIGDLKKLRILSEKYRNRRRRFSLRFNLISGFYNYEI